MKYKYKLIVFFIFINKLFLGIMFWIEKDVIILLKNRSYIDIVV